MTELAIEKSRKNPSNALKIGRVLFLIVGEAAILIFGGIFLRIYMVDLDINAVIYIDNLSWLPIIGMIFIVLAVTGLLKEFGRAFAYCFKGESELTAAQVKRAAFSIKLSIVTALLTGILMTIVVTIGILYSPVVGQTDNLPLVFGNSIIGMLYSIIAAILLLPIYAKLKIKILRKG